MVERILGSKEVAQLLGVCEKTLRTTLQVQGLVPVRIGRKLAYTESIVEQWLADQQREAERIARASGRVVELFNRKVTHGVG
jgi:predicted DNA-binding transcriptional regulator AlpA